MPKPNQQKRHNDVNMSNLKGFNSERVLLETKPNLWLYSDNFILKIIVLFFMVFMFAPIMTIIYSIQSNVQKSFQLNIQNLMFIVELLLIFCIIIVLIKIILDILDWNYTIYKLTDSRIVIQRGFLHKERVTMSYNKIQDIEISQSLLERIMNVGDIILYGANDNYETILDDIPNPKEAEDIILSNINSQPMQNYNTSFNGYNVNNYPQQNSNRDVHYFNNEWINQDEEVSSSQKTTNKWNNKTKKNYPKEEINKEDIFRKHDEMFKRHKK